MKFIDKYICMKNYFLGPLIVLLFISCSVKHSIDGLQTYYYGSNKIILYPNNKYQCENMTGVSYGFWKIYNDTLILNSEYDPIFIKKVKVDYSKANNNHHTIISLYLFNESIPRFAELKLISDEKDTTVTFYAQDNHRLKKEFGKAKVFIHLKDINPETQIFDLKMMDTINIYIDYPINYYNYTFFKNKKFIIKKDNKLEPVG